MGQVFRGDAHAVVLDLDNVFGQVHPYVAALAPVAHGVAGEVVEHLPEVLFHAHALHPALDGNGDALLRRLRRKRGGDLPRHVADVHILRFFHGLGPGAAQMEDVLDDVQHALALAADHAHAQFALLGGVGHALVEHLGKAHHRGQRAAQFVRGVGHKIVAQGQRARDFIQIVLEPLGEVGDIVQRRLQFREHRAAMIGISLQQAAHLVHLQKQVLAKAPKRPALQYIQHQKQAQKPHAVHCQHAGNLPQGIAEAQNKRRGDAHGGVERQHGLRVGKAQALANAALQRRLYLGAGGMVLHGEGVRLAVCQHQPLLHEERHPQGRRDRGDALGHALQILRGLHRPCRCRVEDGTQRLAAVVDLQFDHHRHGHGGHHHGDDDARPVEVAQAALHASSPAMRR